MTIRNRLLFSYIFISLTSSVLITVLFFNHFSSTIKEEIESDLIHGAFSMMQDIDRYLFERIQDLTLLKNLEIMQNIRGHDANKRLADFLNKMNMAYQGMSQNLIALDNTQKIIATNDKSVIQTIPDIHNLPWHLVKMTGSQKIYLKTSDIEQTYFSLAVIIPDQVEQGILGYLHTAIEWKSIDQILEQMLPFEKEDTTSYALLVDRHNQVIAASRVLRQAGLLNTQLPEEWIPTANDSLIQQVSLPAIDADTWLLTWSNSIGHHAFEGLGWKVAVMTRLSDTYQPIIELRNMLIIFIAFTTLFAAMISLWTSKRIAQPIIQLAKFTRNFKLNTKNLPPQIKASGEVAELSKQFTLMIADLDKSQQEKVRMAKFAVIAEMSATMAHEIRTPLGILRSSSQMLAREKNLSAVAHEMIGFISSETTRLNELVTQLLESSRPQSAEYKQQPIGAVIEHAIDLLAIEVKQKSIRISLNKVIFQEQLSYDWDQMLQVFLNLIMNAIQHVNKGGKIEIKLKTKPDKLLIQISDNGSGVSENQKEKIFEAFYTSRQKGTGLGLTVVQQIISAHNGIISISDSQWGGACFTIELPLTEGTSDEQ